MAKRNKGILLGAIADDFTGATDLCNTLVAHGMRTVQEIGVPKGASPAIDADAVVIALKSRTAPVRQATRQSRQALRWLQAAGAEQIFFKYCSTFDSTDEGNIGPVAESLLAALKSDFTIACPAFPTNGRTVFQGHLFVGRQLLSDTHMRNHPLNPMRDSNLVTVLDRQTRGAVGLVPYDVVTQGADVIRAAMDALRKDGKRHAIVDAITDQHLIDIGHACRDLALITGGSGVAMGLPDNFRAMGALRATQDAGALARAAGHAAVLAGSCSAATLGQIAHMKARHPAFFVDPLALGDGKDLAAEAVRWAAPKLADGPVLIYASAEPKAVRRAQRKLGREQAGAMIEKAMAKIAKGLVKAGVGRLIVAGGETAGAVVGALGVHALHIGQQIDPGVPWTMSLGEPKLHLALKSGNFGTIDFFTKAFEVLE